MTHRRFAILDRDGTIITEQNYLSVPERVELITGAAEALCQLRAMGLGLVLITNQSGLGRGFFIESTLERIHQRMKALLHQEGVWLDGIYCCPHTPEQGCQ